MGKVPLYGFVSYRLVQVQKLVHYGLIVYMAGDSAETVILGDGCHKALTVVLTERLCIPWDAFLYIATVQTGLVH